MSLNRLPQNLHSNDGLLPISTSTRWISKYASKANFSYSSLRYRVTQWCLLCCITDLWILLFPCRPPNTCDGKITSFHFPVHQQPCILTHQHTLYLGKLSKTTITSIVAITQYWNKKQWNKNLIIGITHLNTHKTTRMQFQTSCFNFLRLATRLCSTCTYLFILVGIGSSLSTKRVMGTMDCYHNNNNYNYYFERKLDSYPQHYCSYKRFNYNNKCKRFNCNKKCKQGGGK